MWYAFVGIIVSWALVLLWAGWGLVRSLRRSSRAGEVPRSAERPRRATDIAPTSPWGSVTPPRGRKIRWDKPEAYLDAPEYLDRRDP